MDLYLKKLSLMDATVRQKTESLQKQKESNRFAFQKKQMSKAPFLVPLEKKLRYFRARIEATVSMLMRMFGLTRILNKGLRSFKNTAKAAVVTYNLFILSRAQLNT